MPLGTLRGRTVGTLADEPPTPPEPDGRPQHAARRARRPVASIAAVILSFDGQWIPAAVLFVGIAAHFGLWGYLRAQKRRDAAATTTIEGIPAAER
jgi:hypothetical protein